MTAHNFSFRPHATIAHFSLTADFAPCLRVLLYTNMTSLHSTHCKHRHTHTHTTQTSCAPQCGMHDRTATNPKADRRYNLLSVQLTFPTTGNSTEPHVSAAQCTKPDPKSAVTMPHTAATITTPMRSVRKWCTISTRSTAISTRHRHTQMISWMRLPATGVNHIMSGGYVYYLRVIGYAATHKTPITATFVVLRIHWGGFWVEL